MLLFENSQNASRAAQNTLAGQMRAACLRPLAKAIPHNQEMTVTWNKHEKKYRWTQRRLSQFF